MVRFPNPHILRECRAFSGYNYYMMLTRQSLKMHGLLALSLLIVLTAVACPQVEAKHHPSQTTVAAAGLSNDTILVIRHAEKPLEGNGLTPTGVQHALAYVHYFQAYTIGGERVRFDDLFAARDSKNSMRPRLTLEPLSHALRMPLQTQYKQDDYTDLVAGLKALGPGKQILICWHHKRIPDLLSELGANPDLLLPNGAWPDDQYSWVIQLRYDKYGHLISSLTRRVDENLANP